MCLGWLLWCCQGIVSECFLKGCARVLIGGLSGWLLGCSKWLIWCC